MDLLNLSKEDSLRLLDVRKETVKMVCLEKPVLNQKVRVAAVLDYSGSMEQRYNSGEVQATLERLFPIAIQFDDNGEMEVWIFDHEFHRLPNMTMDNYYGYVEKEIKDKKYPMGGTKYAPVMKDVLKRYYEEEPASIPNFVLYITDGNNSDREDAIITMREASYYSTFWQYIGIGGAAFTFLKALDDLDDRLVDNANFFAFNNLIDGSDSDLYKKLMQEFPKWLEYPEVKQMLAGTGVIPHEKVTSSSSSNALQKKGGLFGKLFK